MPIQLIDNFDLQSGAPIDNRFVVGGDSYYQSREDIPWKYPGMRIWDLNDNTPYVWTGSTYSSENTLGSVSTFGSPSPGYVAKFGISNTIGASLIFDDGTNIGIANSTPGYRLDVSGTIRSTTGFFGNGSNITNINASNIASGSLGLSYIQLTPGANGDILTNAGSSAQWTGTSSITVGKSSTSQQVILNNTTSTSLHYVVFYDATTLPGDKQLYTSTTKPLSIKPDNGFVGVNLTTAPTAQLDINGQIKIRGGVPVAGKLLTCSDANGLATWSSLADVSVPVGTIIMWGGTLAYIAANLPNWKLCDGTAAPAGSALKLMYNLMGNPFGPNGLVPDLRERFVVGAGSTDNTTVVGTNAYSVGSTGGLNSVTLTKSQLPQHSHKLDNGVDGAVFSNSGDHSHLVGYNDSTRSGGNTGTRQVDGYPGSNGNVGTNTTGAHRHTGNTGDGTTDGLAGASHENRPPYFALCYIIKVN